MMKNSLILGAICLSLLLFSFVIGCGTEEISVSDPTEVVVPVSTRPAPDHILPPEKTKYAALTSIAISRLTQKPEPTSTPQDIKLPGRLLVIVDFILYEIQQNLDSYTPSVIIIAENVRLEDISPDRKYLINDDGEYFYIQNLDSGERKSIDIPVTDLNSVSWAPNNQQFSLAVFPSLNTSTEDEILGLYIVDLSGNIEKIYQPKGRNYSLVGLTGEGKTYYSRFTSGEWLDDRHLLFNGFEGPMPYVISGSTLSELDPNTLYLFSLDTPGEIGAYSEQWEDYETCHSDRTYILVGGKDLYVLEGTEPTLIAECKDCPELDFLKQSCGTYLPIRLSDSRYETFLFYPQGTFDSPVGYQVKRKGIYPNDMSWDGVFVGDPDDGLVVVFSTTNKYGNNAKVIVSLYDLNIDWKTNLEIFKQESYVSVKIVDWLP